MVANELIKKIKLAIKLNIYLIVREEGKGSNTQLGIFIVICNIGILPGTHDI